MILRHTFRLVPIFLIVSIPPMQGAAKTKTTAPPTKVEGQDVIDHLEATISWYRHVVAAEQLSGIPTDLVVRDLTLQRALHALQLAFDFARAEAAFLAAQSSGSGGAAPATADPGAPGRNLTQAATGAAERVAQLQGRLNEITAALGKAPAKERPALEARVRELQAGLVLAQQAQSTIQGMLNVVGETGFNASNAAGLMGQIATLERSVPEARHQESAHRSGKETQASTQNGLGMAKPASASGAPASASAVSFRPESEGLVVLATDLFTFQRAESELKQLIAETDALERNIDRLKAPLVSEVRSAIQQSQKLIADSSGEDVNQIEQDRRQIESLTARFKQLSTAVVPIGEQQVLVENTRTSLTGWRGAIGRQAEQTGKYLILRTAFILFAIVIVLAVSGIWNRATVRYITDPRRRRQVLVLRRVLVTFAILVIVALGFVTDFSSVATYAGFLTAGIALGLQNVILSVCAYFFLIGKYGIKVGDRVTIAGVTGDVIDIGLVRMYLMELAGTGGEVHPTGRTVVYANSIVFQPSAFFKQVPGADYGWHTAALTLSPDTGYEKAKASISDAVQDVYKDYRAAIFQKHKQFEKSVEMDVAAPEPQVVLTYVENGLQAKVRYPADAKQSAATDERILRTLRDLIEKSPDLHIVSPPKLVEN